MLYSKTWLSEGTITTIGVCLEDWSLPLSIAYNEGHLRVTILCFYCSITFYPESER